MKAIKVVVHGALGRAGQAAVDILCREPGIDVVGVVDVRVSEAYKPLPNGSGKVPASSDLDAILTTCSPDVLVDFTEPAATMSAVRAATKRGVNLVIGTTGLTDDQMSMLKLWI